VRRTFPGTPATSEFGGITVCSGITAPAAMMQEIDAPIRVFGKHWGGFRTAYKL